MRFLISISVVALCTLPSLVNAQAQTQAQSDHDLLCSQAQGTINSPRNAAGLIIDNQTRLNNGSGITLATGKIADPRNVDIYVYDGNDPKAPSKFYARYKEPLVNRDNEPNAPKAGLMILDPETLKEATKNKGTIVCPADAVYNPHYIYDGVKEGDILCVKREKEGEPISYGVILVDAICMTGDKGTVFNWLASSPANKDQPNVFKDVQLPPQPSIPVGKP